MKVSIASLVAAVVTAVVAATMMGESERCVSRYRTADDPTISLTVEHPCGGRTYSVRDSSGFTWELDGVTVVK